MSDHLNDCDCCQRKLAALRIAGAIDGIHLRQRDAYRDVLTDLIAELQDASTGYDPDCQNGCGDVPGAGCPTHYEQAVERAADRAEARLREVTGESVSPGTYEDMVEHSRRVAERKFGTPGDDLDDLCPHCGATKGVCGVAELPLHRTEAGWPNCATCDGGGCPDCTDPA